MPGKRSCASERTGMDVATLTLRDEAVLGGFARSVVRSSRRGQHARARRVVLAAGASSSSSRSLGLARSDSVPSASKLLAISSSTSSSVGSVEQAAKSAGHGVATPVEEATKACAPRPARSRERGALREPASPKHADARRHRARRPPRQSAGVWLLRASAVPASVLLGERRSGRFTRVVEGEHEGPRAADGAGTSVCDGADDARPFEVGRGLGRAGSASTARASSFPRRTRKRRLAAARARPGRFLDEPGGPGASGRSARGRVGNKSRATRGATRDPERRCPPRASPKRPRGLRASAPAPDVATAKSAPRSTPGTMPAQREHTGIACHPRERARALWTLVADGVRKRPSTPRARIWR